MPKYTGRMLTIALAALLQSSGDWPAWRGPRGDGSADPGQTPPTAWSAAEGVVWKAEVPGRGHGSPIVVGEYVYLAACDEGKGSQSLLCYARATGKVLWETVVHAAGAMRKNPKSTGASSTPACDGERIYITFPNADAVTATALGRDGKILWQTKFSDYQIHQGYAASPFLHGPHVLVSADHKGGGAVAALDRKTGVVAWTRRRPGAPNYASPVVLRAAGKEQLILTGCDVVTSLNPLTGEPLWEVAGATTECVTTTVTDGKRIYTSGGYPKNHLAAVEADGSGQLTWETKDRIYVPSFLIREGHLYGVLDAGVTVCLDAASGKERWRQRLGGTFSASLVLAGERIYATNEAGEVFVYRASPNQYEELGRGKLGDEVLATPAICGNRVYHRVAEKVDGRRQERLYCLGAAP